MRVLVVGGGGREHALVRALHRGPSVSALGCAPGNPGIAALATLHPVAADDVAGLVELARRERYDLVVVGPEKPLTLGLADALAAAAIPVFGCSRAAAEIEGSKSFAKALMERHAIPTAEAASCNRTDAGRDTAHAIRWADTLLRRSGRVVLKADGLAAGKGVVICDSMAEVELAWSQLLDGGAPRVVIEEFLVGREASCMALVDGEGVWPLPACEDHKTVLDGDRGPMTGGMGAISPTPVVDDALLERVEREVLRPTASALVREGRPFRGLLYAGLMVCADGPRVLEFNCRFGDPETQPVLARLDGDLGEALLAVAQGRPPSLRFSREAACGVVLAARGYPGPVERGAVIRGIERAEASGALVFHAGTRRDGERLLVDGGRVLTVTATGPDLAAARERAYRAVGEIHFDGMHCRRDIGARG